MKALNVIGSILLGVLAGRTVPAPAAEPSAAKPEPVGVVAIAPNIEALGVGWTEKRIVFAIDPLAKILANGMDKTTASADTPNSASPSR